MTKKTKVKTAVEGTGETFENTNEKVTEAAKPVTNLFQALATGGRAAFEGVVAVDTALLGYAGESVKSYVDLGRQSFTAKSVNDLFELHIAHAHGRIEQNAANTREVLKTVQINAKDACTPVQEALASNLTPKKAAA